MSERGDQLVKRFLGHRSVTQELARRMPDDRADFRPWSGAMSTADLLIHMATSHQTMVGIAAGRGVQRRDTSAVSKDLPSVRRLLDELTEADIADLRAISDTLLDAPAKGFRDIVMPGGAWLDRAREHEIHHKGQLFTYLRMNGGEPPSAWMNR